MIETLLEVKNLCKSFPGVKALQNVSFTCRPGEVHLLVGENGAGKSTLLKILSGLQSADSGTIFLHGKEVRFTNPEQAKQHGIAMVYQELTLLPDMTVAQNIYLQSEPRSGVLINRKEQIKRSQELLDKYDLHIDPEITVSHLSAAKQQMVEILKALSKDPEIIILDESTSSLSKEEVKKLFDIIRMLKKENKLVLFITHRMDEIFQIADRISVMKDGALVKNLSAGDVTENQLVELMVGRSLNDVFPPKGTSDQNQIVFQVKNINIGNKVHDVSFNVAKGEIVGIAGLQGHGQTELLCGLAGIIRMSSGEICINGKKISYHSAEKAIRSGIVLVPEDRKVSGLCLGLSVQDNLSLASLKMRRKCGLINKKQENKFVADTIRDLMIKTPSAAQKVNSLSGGNQQKVVLGKCLATNPKVLLFDEPCRGIDVSAKQEFYKIMRSLSDNGITIILHSSDMLEVVGICDRVLVMYEGRITGSIQGEEITEENIMRSAVGLSSNKEGA